MESKGGGTITGKLKLIARTCYMIQLRKKIVGIIHRINRIKDLKKLNQDLE